MSSLRVLDFPCEGAGALLRDRRLRLELGAEVGPPPDAADDGDVAEHDGQVRRHLHYDDLAPEGIGRAASADGGVWLWFYGTEIFSHFLAVALCSKQLQNIKILLEKRFCQCS